ncbi:hypothetical protein GQ53DRAFT_833485 [Thozetella sp. PMI_491]|nr:hypothetical protein GQ53DRAFT_833485 [Thozetella sp. PMI_491]
MPGCNFVCFATSKNLLELRPGNGISTQVANAVTSPFLGQRELLVVRSKHQNDRLSITDEGNLELQARIQQSLGSEAGRSTLLQDLIESQKMTRVELIYHLEEIAKLRIILKTREKHIIDLNQYLHEERVKHITDLDQQEKEKLYDSFQQDPAAAVKKLGSTEEKLAFTRGELAVTQQRLASTRGELASTEEELAVTKQRLHFKTTRLSELDNLAFKMTKLPREAIAERLSVIFTSAYKLAEVHFYVDLEEAVLANPSPWDIIQKYDRVENIPLPRTNTLVAKKMRTAAVLAVIAVVLAEHIFLPIYLLEESDELFSLMSDLAYDDPSRESYLRAVLLSLLPDKQTQLGRKRIKNAVRDVLACVAPLLVDEKQDMFRTAIENLCEQACEQWMHLQQIPEKVKCLVNV